MALYLEAILPGISAPGQDNNFGSSAMYDVLALQVGGPVWNCWLACPFGQLTCPGQCRCRDRRLHVTSLLDGLYACCLVVCPIGAVAWGPEPEEV